jgi:hypothetical protein
MGFGAFGKDLRLRGGGFLQQLGGFVNRITSALKPVAGTIAGVIDHFAPGVGSAIKTGFDVVDVISGQLKGGASPSGRKDYDLPPSLNTYTNTPAGKRAIDSRRLAQFNSQFKPTFKPNGKVDSILNNRIQAPRLAGGGAQTYDSDEDGSEVSDEVSE